MAWTLPPQDAEGIDVRFSPGEDGELNVEVTSFDDEAGPRNFYRTVLRLVSPDLEPTQTLLEQVGPGRYAGTVRADQQGAYLVRVAQTFEDESGTDAASRTLGIVSPAAEEYRRLGIDADALATYAAAGGGRELALADEEAPTAVWTHDIEASAFPTPIWPWLLLLAIAARPARRRRSPRGAQSRRPAASARVDGATRRDGPRGTGGRSRPRRAARGKGAQRPSRGARGIPRHRRSAGPPAGTVSSAGRTPARTRRPRSIDARGTAPAAAAPPPTAQPEPGGETLAERLARRRRQG